MDQIEEKLRQIRNDFPLLSNRNIIYLDNAATTQKPQCVIEAFRNYYEFNNANPFRGVYELSDKATKEYEDARSVVSGFLHAKEAAEIVFTRNATESLNLVAYSWGLQFLKPGDEIVVSVMEHHSNFLPWDFIAQKTGAVLRQLLCNEEGEITQDYLNVINEKTKIVAITHISNVIGRLNDIKKISILAHSFDAILVLDGAQSVPHIPVDVVDLDVDFLAFSGHKMLAPMGIGVLYGKRKLLEKMPPFLRGGEMIETVHWNQVTFAPLPHKFEAGTVNVGGAVALRAAIEYIEKVGFDLIQHQEHRLTKLAIDGLRELKGVKIFGSPKAEEHQGIVTFSIENIHPHDVASILDAEHINIRAGHHCAQPLMDYLGVNATSRVSFSFYNTEEEVYQFIEAVGKIRGQMGY